MGGSYVVSVVGLQGGGGVGWSSKVGRGEEKCRKVQLIYLMPLLVIPRARDTSELLLAIR